MSIKSKIRYLILTFVIIVSINAGSIFYAINNISILNHSVQNESNIFNQFQNLKFIIKSLQEKSLEIALSKDEEDLKKLLVLKEQFWIQVKELEKFNLSKEVNVSLLKMKKTFDGMFLSLFKNAKLGIKKEKEKEVNNEMLLEFTLAVDNAKDTIVSLYGIIIRSHVTQLQMELASMQSIYIAVLASGDNSNLASAKKLKKKIMRKLNRALRKNKDKAEYLKIVQQQIIHIEALANIGNDLSTHGVNYVKYTKEQDIARKTANKLVKDYFKTLDLLSIQLKKNVNKKLVQNESSLSTLENTASVSTFFYIVFLIILFVITKKIISNILRLSAGVNTLMAFSSADQEIKINTKDELNDLANSFNTYMKSLRSVVIEDQKIVEEVEKSIQMAKAGFFFYTINTSSKNRSTNDLKNALNEMIHDFNDKFTAITAALVEYGNTNFQHEMKVNNVGGTISSIVSASNTIGSNVSELLATIMITGQNLSNNIDTLSLSANSLSLSSTQQAASLEETAASIEEITLENNKNAKNIIQMSQLADSLIHTSQEGKELAFKTSVSMQEIEEKISSINTALSIIDSISFKTNILSLNAAVEAATAGEAGKGFAVVAQEVRNLANSSAQAAKDIKTLVSSATTTSKEGKEISKAMIEGYDDLKDKITQTKNIIDLVTKASRKQDSSMQDINNAISNLDKNTQENASDASSISSMSKEVQDLSNKLIQIASSSTYNKKAHLQVSDMDFSNKLNSLKLDHITFKEESFLNLVNKEAYSIQESNETSLGKWIEASILNKENYVQGEHWEVLVKNNSLTHEKIKHYLELNKNSASNEQLLAVNNEIQEASSLIFEALDTSKIMNCKEG